MSTNPALSKYISYAYQPSSSMLINPLVWKAIWYVDAPPKIKHFLWRVLNRATATKLELFRRRCGASPLTPFCNLHEESIEHAFLLCPWVERVWFRGHSGYRVTRDSVTSFHVWLVHMYEGVSGSREDWLHSMALITFTCWHNWQSRCNAIFNHKLPSPHQTWLTISAATISFFNARVVRSGGIG